MNEISNYGDLKVAVQKWLNRKDSATVDNIPMFINFAEKQFTRLVRLPYYETRFVRTIVKDSEWVEIPNDFLSVKHFTVNGFAVTRVDVETFTRLKKENMGEDGKPYYFTRIGSKMYTYPTLQENDQIEVIYNRDIPEMKVETDCPYSLIIAPDVMLYLALRHASIFLRDNEQEVYWAQKAVDAANDVNAQLDEAEWHGSTLVVRMFEEGEV
ncbi:hypothetical protein LAh8_74 [Aeromonas phage LAh_8]|uniref:Uncharacterized protein n=3 Tax=Lahexavirus TaxID=2843411 RepID=A0A513ZZR6_9CAUD|nr:virion structural protein [Aeromonas phage 4_4572]YP_009847189.1 virion structural protein [Aeromonas phage LAh_6]YP_009847412.1 virion structural protein [Aeromonas phage LAh_8]QDH46520.1 hypothetical protein LAh6_15 [Aeromonas phage LAh_6]QDH46755.1 hypothetical protein LAh8_74 [Aeromonas phage LAh_8]QEG09073.1 hypothetical protein [Aeromonas phage 4_4572]